MKSINFSRANSAFTVCLLVLSLSGCDQLGLTGSKVAYVDVARVLSESSLGRQEAQRNQDVKNVLLKAESDAKEKYKTMPDKQQQQSRNADSMALNQLWQAEQQHSRTQSVKVIAEAAETYRASHNLDYVMISTSVLAAKTDKNITAELIKQLENKKVDYGHLPEISVVDNSDGSVQTSEAASDEKNDMAVSH